MFLIRESVMNEVLLINFSVSNGNWGIQYCGQGKESSIKSSKFSEAQSAFDLKQAVGGAPIGLVCRKV